FPPHTSVANCRDYLVSSDVQAARPLNRARPTRGKLLRVCGVGFAAADIMSAIEDDSRPLHDPEAELERALIDEFLRSRGRDRASLELLPPDERQRLLQEASLYAAARLTEVEARARFVHDLHGEH